ncbi:hypothetical protein LWI28_011018 [Acer negundo]|uniref:Epidermal patterning factor-like protein n=1 Tax=Acer negundo TaxID=4023 RepID=A0AAD5P0G6_ACENE|nr:hypothetical protein LWI28_011018 [Acer negundo]
MAIVLFPENTVTKSRIRFPLVGTPFLIHAKSRFSLLDIPMPSVLASVLHSYENCGTEGVKMVLGSRPPQCVNKCLNCRPCVATLVVPSHPKNHHFKPQEDENYYLLSWKCRCGNKLFQP